LNFSHPLNLGKITIKSLIQPNCGSKKGFQNKFKFYAIFY